MNPLCRNSTCRPPNPLPTLKASFQVYGFGGAELVRTEEMDQFGIIPLDQGVHLLNAEFFQVIHELT
jgi:hypothetical protein